jgi:hypothetical protein
MARRGRKRDVIDHAPVRDLALEDYLRARDMVAAYKSQPEITRVCEITGPQYFHMWRHGFPARASHEAQPSFESFLAAQASAMQKAGNDAAEAVGGRGVQVLGLEVANSHTANRMAEMVMRDVEERMAAEMLKPMAVRDLASVMPAESTTRFLSALSKWSSLTRAAAAFDRLYGTRLGGAWTRDGKDPIDTTATARELMPAALSSREEVVGGDAGKTYQLVEAAKTFDGWTQEEIDRYADNEEEPPGKG